MRLESHGTWDIDSHGTWDMCLSHIGDIHIRVVIHSYWRHKAEILLVFLGLYPSPPRLCASLISETFISESWSTHIGDMQKKFFLFFWVSTPSWNSYQRRDPLILGTLGRDPFILETWLTHIGDTKQKFITDTWSTCIGDFETWPIQIRNLTQSYRRFKAEFYIRDVTRLIHTQDMK